MKQKDTLKILTEAYFSDNPHEIEVLETLQEIIGSIRVFVDIGASLGQYSRKISQIINNGFIIAIEPDPIRFGELEKNCKEWQIGSTNKIEALHSVISDVDGEINFYSTGSNVSGGLFSRDLNYLPEEFREGIKWKEIQVKTYRLDTLFKSVFKELKPDLIKIDVEGSELRVLRGCDNILSEGTSSFLIEIHGWADPEGQKNPSEIFSLMKSFGYGKINFSGRYFFTKNPIRKFPYLWFKGVLFSMKDVFRRIFNKLRRIIAVATLLIGW